MLRDMASDFVKMVEDALRLELSVLRIDYNEVIEEVEERADGAFVRTHPPYEDFELDEPDAAMSSDQFSARLARRLRVVLEAPSRPAAPPEGDQ
jgi:hypothetical protein